LVSLIAQAEAASLEEDWSRAIELLQKALAAVPAEIDKSRPELKAGILRSIGHFYYELENPKAAKKYFALSIKCIKGSGNFQAQSQKLAGHLDRPVREMPFAVDGLPFTDEPYNGLVVPDSLPLLQHMVHILRPHGINVHAWCYMVTAALDADIDAGWEEFLPDCLPPAKLAKLRRPRPYRSGEAVLMRGKDGYMYKLVAPGKLSKVRGSRL
jgi:hypothetical protein